MSETVTDPEGEGEGKREVDQLKLSRWYRLDLLLNSQGVTCARELS